MPPPVDPSQDYLLTEQPEDVTYFSRVTESTFNPPAGALVHWAKGFMISKEIATSDAQLWQNGRIFQLWKVPLQEAGLFSDPKPKDKLTDKFGVTWIVQQVDKVSFGWRFRLTCLRAVQ